MSAPVDLRRLNNLARLAAVEPYLEQPVVVRTTEPREVRGVLIAAAAQRWAWRQSPILIIRLDGTGENGRGDVAIPSAQVQQIEGQSPAPVIP